MVGLTAFLAGLGLARTGWMIELLWVMPAFLLLIFSKRRKDLVTLIAALLFGLGLGWWRGAVFMNQLEPFRELTGERVVFQASVESDAVYSYQGQLSFDVGRIEFLEPFQAKTPGRITVRGLGENAIYRGDTLRIEGTLLPTRGSRQARMSFASFKVIERSSAPMEKVRRDFVAGMETALPEPSASFGLGLLLGYRTTLPESLNEELKAVGLTHIIAVSGYNLTVIVRSVRRMLRKRSKYQQFIIASLLILLFLSVTDFSASIVRASIVSGLSLGAWYYGRTFKPLLILLLSGVVTAAWNPLYVWSDIGWYLSFLAFFGVLIVAPMMVKLIYRNRREPHELIMIGLETTAAQLLTAPLGLYIFGTTSSVALLSNIVIGPLTPFVMVLSLVAGLSGMTFPILAGWLALPARWLLGYMLDIVNLMARIPHALVEQSITLTQMLLMYGLIIVVTVLLSRKTAKLHAIITDKIPRF